MSVQLSLVQMGSGEQTFLEPGVKSLVADEGQCDDGVYLMNEWGYLLEYVLEVVLKVGRIERMTTCACGWSFVCRRLGLCVRLHLFTNTIEQASKRRFHVYLIWHPLSTAVCCALRNTRPTLVLWPSISELQNTFIRAKILATIETGNCR
jgi:hypothetical protein